MSVKRIDSSLTAAVADHPSVRPCGVTRSLEARPREEGREAGRRDGWIDGGQGAVDARAVAVGRYFRTVRSATKDGQAAEEREGVTLTGGRTDGRVVPAGKCEGRGEGGFRTALPSAARRHRSRLSFSLSPFFLPFAVTAAVDLAVWLAAAERQQQQGERASERERKGGGGRGGDSGGEGNQDSRRDERASGRSSGRSKSLLT